MIALAGLVLLCCMEAPVSPENIQMAKMVGFGLIIYWIVKD